MFLCSNCQKNPADLKSQVYKDKISGKEFVCSRMFCSDKCEEDYKHSVDQSHSEDLNRFERVA